MIQHQNPTYKILLLYNRLNTLLKLIYEVYGVSYYESSKTIDEVIVYHLTCLIPEQDVLDLLELDSPKLNLFGAYRALSYRMDKISKNDFELVHNSLTYFIGNAVPKTLNFYNTLYEKLQDTLNNVGA